MIIKHQIKYDKNYNIIEFIELDSDGNIISYEEYDEFGNITYRLRFSGWERISYVRFSNIETKQVITKQLFRENPCGWVKYTYFDIESVNDLIGVKVKQSDGSGYEYYESIGNGMSLHSVSLPFWSSYTIDDYVDIEKLLDEEFEIYYIETKTTNKGYLTGETLFRNRDDWLPP